MKEKPQVPFDPDAVTAEFEEAYRQTELLVAQREAEQSAGSPSNDKTPIAASAGASSVAGSGEWVDLPDTGRYRRQEAYIDGFRCTLTNKYNLILPFELDVHVPPELLPDGDVNQHRRFTSTRFSTGKEAKKKAPAHVASVKAYLKKFSAGSGSVGDYQEGKLE